MSMATRTDTRSGPRGALQGAKPHSKISIQRWSFRRLALTLATVVCFGADCRFGCIGVLRGAGVRIAGT
jgi:hypothetical protein